MRIPLSKEPPSSGEVARSKCFREVLSGVACTHATESAGHRPPLQPLHTCALRAAFIPATSP